MGKKSFAAILAVLLITFLATGLLRYYRAPVQRSVTLDRIPLSISEWLGVPDEVPRPVLDLLRPDQLFSATFGNDSGTRVHLFIDYYSPRNTTGAIHSPRNCLPGSGWVISGSAPRTIALNGRSISANRFLLTLGESRQVMDFWYITRYGETANDYVLKLNTMISSLTLKPTDKAFVRFVTADDTKSIAAMEEFEKLIISEIYRNLPF